MLSRGHREISRRTNFERERKKTSSWKSFSIGTRGQYFSLTPFRKFCTNDNSSKKIGRENKVVFFFKGGKISRKKKNVLTSKGMFVSFV